MLVSIFVQHAYIKTTIRQHADKVCIIAHRSAVVTGSLKAADDLNTALSKHLPTAPTMGAIWRKRLNQNHFGRSR